MVIFGNKDRQGNMTVNLCAVPGAIPGIPGGYAICATIDGDNLVINQRIDKQRPVLLPLRKIKDFGTVRESEIVNKGQKSVIGRAAVGGLILGPLGAVIGGIDGTGTKKKKVDHVYWVVNYTNDDGQRSSISFEVVGATLGLKKFERALEAACPNFGLPEATPVGPIVL
ncbi:hypothetical protein [Gordonibacter sp.]|uniref:hypothetical protein n=2 Tax=Gordonibacter sp. TaxID=1968902 RepID=UPI002FC88ED9